MPTPPPPFIRPDYQPLFNLVGKNMALLTQFSMSPEVLSRTLAGVPSMERPAATAGGIAGTRAFAQLMQGLFRNYTEFLAEVAQGAMAHFAQAAGSMVAPAEEALQAAGGSTGSPPPRA